MNIALRRGLGRHRFLFDKTPVPLLSEAEPAVSVYVDNGGILSSQRGKANALRKQLERKLGEVALPTHEAEAKTDDLEMLGMRLHDGRAAPARKSLEAEACYPGTPEGWFRDGGADSFAHRSLYLCFPLAPPVPVGLLHSLPVHSTCGCPAAIPLELSAQRVASSKPVVSARLLRFVTPSPAAGVLL